MLTMPRNPSLIELECFVNGPTKHRVVCDVPVILYPLELPAPMETQDSAPFYSIDAVIPQVGNIDDSPPYTQSF
jgi:hypothetical protein